MLMRRKHFDHRFVPCAAGPALLKTRSAEVKRAVMAQKVLLFRRRPEIRPLLNSPRHSGFELSLMNATILKRRGVLEGKLRGAKTQPYHLITKGRNQRQIHE
jgi:hypothetical protein